MGSRPSSNKDVDIHQNKNPRSVFQEQLDTQLESLKFCRTEDGSSNFGNTATILQKISREENWKRS